MGISGDLGFDEERRRMDDLSVLARIRVSFEGL
jgi:hypothetical protein